MTERERKETTEKREKEIFVPESSILRHVCHSLEAKSGLTKLEVIDAQNRPLPVWNPDSFYLANIGEDRNPLFLELRFEEASKGLWIALLMTNERRPRDLESMGRRLMEKINQRGIKFEAVIGVEASGSKLSQEIARLVGQYTLQSTFQKGKPRIENGRFVIGPPKEWVGLSDSVVVTSGTSGKSPQAIFMDRKIAHVFSDKPTLILDEARLTSGTLNSSIELARKMGINVVAVATVLNETEPADKIDQIPYFNLVKLPVFTKDDKGFHPIEGSFNGVECFYQEITNIKS